MFQLCDQITNSGRPINIRTLIPFIYVNLPHYSHNTGWFALPMKRKNKISFRAVFPSEFRLSWCWKKVTSQNRVLFEELDAIWMLRNFKSSLESISSLCFSKYSAFGMRYWTHDINLQPHNLTPWNEVLHVKLNHSSASKETLSPFMEPTSSLPCSKALTDCPHPEPHKLSPHIFTFFIKKIYFNITLQSKPRSSTSLSLSHQTPVLFIKFNSNFFSSSSPGLTKMRTSATWIFSVIKFNKHNT
jgi:hypothetical protein